MTDAVRLDEQFAILSESETLATTVRVLKHGDSFAVFDPHGDILRADGYGLFHSGTRFLSAFELMLGNRRPLLLSSTISEDNLVFTADLTNPDVVKDGQLVLARGLLHVLRSRVMYEGGCIDRIRVTGYGDRPIELTVGLRFDTDFADIFEVRGVRRARRGDPLPDLGEPDRVLRYRGLDGVVRRTRIRSMRPVDRNDDRMLSYRLRLDPDASVEIEVAIGCEIGDETPPLPRYADVLAHLTRHAATIAERDAAVSTSSEGFNRWLCRSAADLRMMITETPNGPYPYAGIPWFSTPFGRDGVWTAFELLWAAPDVARGVLRFLADTQATVKSDVQDAEPGKILHEMRGGEMATLGEIPFGRYYGSVDATPLFVMLAAAYYARTADRALIDAIWPHVLAALDWMSGAGDADGDGFIEYSRCSGHGLVNQGWKDSYDAVFHADGRLATPPIALCEVQGYAYAAWMGAAFLAAARAEQQLAASWRERAASLQARFEAAFWCDDLGTYALALDGDKHPCRVPTSNPGHCLFTGIVAPEHAARLAHTLMSPESFSGWGLRTVATGAIRYNPMSYHDGSVWPHDTAIAAAGLARYGFTWEATRILEAMFDLSRAAEFHRLPELICGFDRGHADAPTLYPVACSPQSWAAGAVYLLLEACLGLRIDAVAGRISLHKTVLPGSLDWLRISNLSVGDTNVDLLVTRHAHDAGVTVMRRHGAVEIVALK